MTADVIVMFLHVIALNEELMSSKRLLTISTNVQLSARMIIPEPMIFMKEFERTKRCVPVKWMRPVLPTLTVKSRKVQCDISREFLTW
jgi:hypothetical protein